VIAVDPSKGGKDKSHDYSAIVFMGVHEGLVHVDASLDRRPPHQIIRDTLAMCDRYKPDFLGFEANQFQELLVHEFERVCQQRFGTRWPVYKLVNKVNKEVRIRRLSPYLANREMRFKQDSPGCRLLVDQLIDFPHADHDDGPDALELGIRDSGLGTRDSGLGIRDSGLGTRDSGLGIRAEFSVAKWKNAKCKRRSGSNRRELPCKRALRFSFCILHFAFFHFTFLNRRRFHPS